MSARTESQAFLDGFKKGVAWIFGLPLPTPNYDMDSWEYNDWYNGFNIGVAGANLGAKEYKDM